MVREFLFVSLFRACAQSLAAEKARRFATMQRAERNINELLSELTVSYHRRRQATIDEEFFDLIAGYEALRSQGLHTAMRASAGLSPPRSRCRCAESSS